VAFCGAVPLMSDRVCLSEKRSKIAYPGVVHLGGLFFFLDIT
jgi:hypothetical protein